MRQFGSSGFRLWNLGADAKTLYTAFCLLTFLGVVSSALYYRELVGVGTSGIRRYYAGEDNEPERTPLPPTTQQPGVGPAIEVPPEGTPASVRGRLIREFAPGHVVRASWHTVRIGDGRRRRVVRLT